jgi:hypothetical protein
MVYVELYGPHFVRAFTLKNYEVTARARVGGADAKDAPCVKCLHRTFSAP